MFAITAIGEIIGGPQDGAQVAVSVTASEYVYAIKHPSGEVESFYHRVEPGKVKLARRVVFARSAVVRP